jgi:hypothetical protein
MSLSIFGNYHPVQANLFILIAVTLVMTMTLRAENCADLGSASDKAKTSSGGNSLVQTIAEGKNSSVTNAITASTFNLNVSENYDSLYMFRGVNQIANTGVLSTTFNPIWHISKNDQLSVPFWFATVVGKTGSYGNYGYGMQLYRELDVPVNYTHLIGPWTLGFGYGLYNYFNDGPSWLRGGYLNPYGPAQQGVQHEINENIAYTFTNGFGSFTPSLIYYQELGTANTYSYGCVNAGSSFLTASLTSRIPLVFLKKDRSITCNPNTQLNFSFRYNNMASANYVSTAYGYTTGGYSKAYTGFNNWQFQIPITWQVTKLWSLTGYWAYSYQGCNLLGTAPSTCWAGASVGMSF